LWSFFAASCSVLSSRVVPPRINQVLVCCFWSCGFVPTCCHPTSEKGVFVLCVTCIGELGLIRTDLSGNPAQRCLKLLVNVAKKCRGRRPPFGALSQEGNAGLERTVDSFDPERGLRDRGRAVHLPLHEGETGSPRPTPPARRSPPNSDATPALGNLQDASARGGSRRRPLGAGGSHWTVEARATRRRELRRAGRRARGFDGLHDALLEGGLRGLVRDHLGGSRRRPPQSHAAGTHGHRPSSATGSAAAKPKARGRRRGARPEPRARA
jgi:hypothetical protein